MIHREAASGGATFKILVVLFAALLAWFLAPFYVFVAEDEPALVPFGWRALPAGEVPYASKVQPGFEEMAAELEAVLREHHAVIGVPAISAAVASEGEVIWAAAAGWADVEAAEAATTDTVFRIGSTSKAVTGTVLARLVDDGVVTLDAPISSWATNLPNEDWNALTLRQLASHTAGIVGYGENTDWVGVYRGIWPRRSVENVEAGLGYFDGSDLLFEPGTDFHYSSYDVVLESAVLQAAAGKPFDELLIDTVNAPLGIASPLRDGERADRATFYMTSEKGVHETFDYDVSHRLAGGGMMGRPKDLALLGAAWLDDGFIRTETRETFWTPQTLADGTVNEQNYAINWRVRDELSSNLTGFNANHGGVGKGSMSWLVVVPEDGIALSLMINTRVYPFHRWVQVQNEIVPIVRRYKGL